MKNQQDNIQDIRNQLSLRKADKISINSNALQGHKNLILSSQCDYGVIRNGGRRGANFGPRSILNSLSSMNASSCNQLDHKVIRSKTAEICFDKQQEIDTNAIEETLSSSLASNIWHLGGGHDHIYPLLMALREKHEKICVLNIDAHLDTRVDPLFHSGTPFRQFSNQYKGEFSLIQMGIHKFANTKNNFSKLQNGKMEVYTTLQMQKESSNFTNVAQFLEQAISLDPDYQIVLSLDCDAIESTTMEGVSAVNHDGLSLKTVKDIFSWYFSKRQAKSYVGIYEYNPIFDNLSNKGSRAIASLMESFL